MSLWKREPTLIVAVLLAAIVGAILVFATALDPAARAALVGVLVVLGGFVTRSQVTPTSGPSADGDGGTAYRRPPPPDVTPPPTSKPALRLLVLRWLEPFVGRIPLSLLLCVVAPVVACTATQARTAITIGGVACEVIVQAADPALDPLCATAEEVAQAILALDSVSLVKGPHTPEAIRSEILRQRAQRAAKATK